MFHLLKTLLTCLIGVGCLNFTHSIIGETPVNTLLIQNMENEFELPRHFRTTQDPFVVEKTSPQLPSREGFDNLNISGSGQFSEKSFELVLHKLNLTIPLYVFDLRQESHGFLNGKAICWYAPRNWSNQNKSVDEILQLEKKLISSLAQEKQVTLHRIIKKDPEGIKLPETISSLIAVSYTSTEKEVVTKYPVEYIRLPVQDHVRPTDATVDRFIEITNNLPKERWLHFHCSAGVGRSTIFMIMYDMMMNAKNVSFSAIMDRHWKIGGSNMLKESPATHWKTPYVLERVEFLKDFYNYCKENQDNYQSLWSTYQNK